jgi:short-subunit dehydrogenase
MKLRHLLMRPSRERKQEKRHERPHEPHRNATKFGLRDFGLALREELRHMGVGVSVINPTFVRDAGMWAGTGVATRPLAGQVTPDQVAEAAVRAIREDRRELAKR